MTEVALADAIRYLDVLLGCSIVGTTFAILLAARRFTPAAPVWHIRLVIVGNLTLVVAVCLEVVSRLGEPLAWQVAPLILVGLLLEQVSLVVMLAWYVERHRRHNRKSDEAAARLRRELAEREKPTSTGKEQD